MSFLATASINADAMREASVTELDLFVRNQGPATVSIEAACARLGIGRSLGYALARQGAFPVKVIRAGRLYRVPLAALEAAIGPDDEPETLAS